MNQDQKPKLLPCPFCGAEPASHYDQVRCSARCFANEWYPVEVWNRRPSADPATTAAESATGREGKLLPSGAVAHVSNDAPPELLTALNTAVELAIKAAKEGKLTMNTPADEMTNSVESQLSELPPLPTNEEEFTKWVGAQSFPKAVSVTIRSSIENGNKIEEMFHQIKSLSKQLREAAGVIHIARKALLANGNTRDGSEALNRGSMATAKWIENNPDLQP